MDDTKQAPAPTPQQRAEQAGPLFAELRTGLKKANRGRDCEHLIHQLDAALAARPQSAPGNWSWHQSHDLVEIRDAAGVLVTTTYAGEGKAIVAAHNAAMTAQAQGNPLAYAIYGIGAGKHYIKDVKLIQATDTNDEWKSDDDGLGEYWAGNTPLFTAPDGAELPLFYVRDGENDHDLLVRTAMGGDVLGIWRTHYALDREDTPTYIGQVPLDIVGAIGWEAFGARMLQFKPLPE